MKFKSPIYTLYLSNFKAKLGNLAKKVCGWAMPLPTPHLKLIQTEHPLCSAKIAQFASWLPSSFCYYCLQLRASPYRQIKLIPIETAGVGSRAGKALQGLWDKIQTGTLIAHTEEKDGILQWLGSCNQSYSGTSEGVKKITESLRLESRKLFLWDKQRYNFTAQSPLHKNTPHGLFQDTPMQHSVRLKTAIINKA